MRIPFGVLIYRLFPESVNNFFESTIIGKIVIWLIVIFILFWIVTVIFLFIEDQKEKYKKIKGTKGINSRYSIINYIIESVSKWFVSNWKMIVLILLIFLPTVVVLIYGKTKGLQ
jgi:uncharacterized membrane protein